MTLSAAERAARYRARKKGAPLPKLRPGPKAEATTPRALQDRIRDLEKMLQWAKSDTGNYSDRHRRAVAEATKWQDEVKELRLRNAELEWLVRTGFSSKSRTKGPFLPLTMEQCDDLRRAKKDDDLDLARDVLIDAWEAWQP